MAMGEEWEGGNISCQAALTATPNNVLALLALQTQERVNRPSNLTNKRIWCYQASLF